VDKDKVVNRKLDRELEALTTHESELNSLEDTLAEEPGPRRDPH
jgi:hypothetical protein